MEEILASIRRIISEDDAAPAAEQALAPEPAPALAEEEEPLVLEDEVLELTDVIEDDPAELAGGAGLDDLDFSEPEPVHAPTPAPKPEAAAPPPPPRPELPPLAPDEPLVSGSVASSAASAFDALERTVLMPPGGRSLEDVVRELLRPMLKAWLEENLPGIVEAQVAAEVERIARQRR
jgi:cell pole-organizing protein PopZ